MSQDTFQKLFTTIYEAFYSFDKYLRRVASLEDANLTMKVYLN